MANARAAIGKQCGGKRCARSGSRPDAWMNAPSASARRLLISVALFTVVLVVSWLGYMAIEGFSPFDSLYMTIATISTVGDSSHQLSDAGRWWTLGVIVFGVGVTGYVFLSAAGYLLEGHLFAAVGEQR